MTNEQIGQILKEARKGAKMTQQQVADCMGLNDRRVIQRYEAGKVNFLPRFISRYCEAISVDWSIIITKTKTDELNHPPAP